MDFIDKHADAISRFLAACEAAEFSLSELRDAFASPDDTLAEIRETVTTPLLPTPALNAAPPIAPVQRTVKASVC